MTHPTTAPDTAPEQRTVIRYLGLGGAIVAVTEDTAIRTEYRFTSTCAGCLDLDDCRPLHVARKWAAGHSAACRALPQPDTDAP